MVAVIVGVGLTTNVTGIGGTAVAPPVIVTCAVYVPGVSGAHGVPVGH
jgi:hypothetical protein